MSIKKEQRLQKENLNYQGYLMKIIRYNSNKDIIVQFQDDYKTEVHTNYSNFTKGIVKNPNYRMGIEGLNCQNCLMKIVEYRKADDIIVEFQDKYKARVHAAYREFKKGTIKNPYYKSVVGHGMIGIKYPSKINGAHTKEYETWRGLLRRCFDIKHKNKNQTYKDVTCCDEWLLYENFYDWLHSQENYKQWSASNGYAIDKDILFKGNKIYSPDTCCLVPQNVNSLFVKKDVNRSNLPIGVTKKGSRFQVWCQNHYAKKQVCLGTYDTTEEAFQVYKEYKEKIIKQVAQEEYSKGNITKQCYNAMMNYEVEITD